MGRHKCPECGRETIKTERTGLSVVYECPKCKDGKIRVWKIELVEEK